MRILLVGPELFVPWTFYTLSALQRLGQNVRVFYESNLLLDRLTVHKSRALVPRIPGLGGRLDRWRTFWHERRDARLLRLAGRWRPDLILVLWGRTLHAGLLERLKRQGRCRLVTWWVDDPFRHSMEDRLPFYDFFFIFDRSYLAPLKKHGARQVRFLPCGCDETVYYPRRLNRREQTRYASDVALVAWCYPNRIRIVQALNGIDVKIWGRGWVSPEAQAFFGGIPSQLVMPERFVKDEETAKIYSATKIGLNIHSDQTQEGGLNARAFELLGTGAFEMTDAVRGMEELLDPGKEVVLYRSPEEARELARYYLVHPEERQRIAGRGRQRVLENHTYFHRMRTLLNEVDAASCRC